MFMFRTLRVSPRDLTLLIWLGSMVSAMFTTLPLIRTLLISGFFSRYASKQHGAYDPSLFVRAVGLVTARFRGIMAAPLASHQEVIENMEGAASPGYPYKISSPLKRDLFENNGDRWLEGCFLEFCRNPWQGLWLHFLKEEIRKVGKDPHGILAGPIDLQYVAMRLFLHQNSQLYDAHGRCWSAIGMSRDGLSWHRLFLILSRFPKGGCSDITEMDAHILSECLRAVCTMRKAFLVGVDASVYSAVDALYDGWIDSICLVNNEVWQKRQGLGTGGFNTSSDTTLVMALYLTYSILVQHSEWGNEEIDRHIAAQLYGDDNDYTFDPAHPELSPEVLFPCIAKAFALEVKSPGTQPVEAFDFLSATFLPHDSFGRKVMVPLFNEKRLVSHIAWSKNKSPRDEFQRVASIRAVAIFDDRLRLHLDKWLIEHKVDVSEEEFAAWVPDYRAAQLTYVIPKFKGALNGPAPLFEVPVAQAQMTFYPGSSFVPLGSLGEAPLSALGPGNGPPRGWGADRATGPCGNPAWGPMEWPHNWGATLSGGDLRGRPKDIVPPEDPPRVEAKGDYSRGILDRLEAGGAVTEPGVNYLKMALDPFPDKEHPVVGMPDGASGRSYVQTYNQTITITKPPGLAAGALFDAHVVFVPELIDPIQNNKLSNTTAFQGVAVEAGGGVLAISTATSAGQQFNWRAPLMVVTVPTGTATMPTGTSSPTPPPVATTGIAGFDLTDYIGPQTRVIGGGFEVINTTPSLYRGGAVVYYTQACEQRPSSIPVVDYSAGSGVPQWGQSSRVMRSPPSTVGQAISIPGSIKRGAEEGAYVVIRQTKGETNPPRDPEAERLVWLNEAQLSVASAAPIVSGFSEANPNLITIAAYPPMSLLGVHQGIPYDVSGAYFTGLNENTSLDVTLRLFIEGFPTPVASQKLVSLTVPCPPLDEAAVELYSKVCAELPVGVPVSENEDGGWWKGLMQTIASVAPTLGAALGSVVPGGAIIGKGVGSVAEMLSGIKLGEKAQSKVDAEKQAIQKRAAAGPSLVRMVRLSPQAPEKQVAKNKAKAQKRKQKGKAKAEGSA